VYGRDINMICTVGDQKVNLNSKQGKSETDLIEFARINLNGELLGDNLPSAGKDE